ncbi:RNA-binding domain-containing protein [Penicillium chermesinum]|uniref:RNA-binding domain-containing protein n=1 Tax=Penicillium chermesinum TaxID=63820 RepID=A0A9W9P628_9EURO|nr:RNA-binding domain-containing protein [Penicillium chermesinum]KAJ5238639.1 RNA-binding domain-containing protein [Penicillium chermesinum]
MEPNKKRRLSGENPATEADTMDAKSSEASTKPRRTLFVRSLPASVTTERLTEYFSQSYVLKHATVVIDPQTKQSKGYGFVTFADLEDAQSALEELNGSDFDGKKIRVDFAQPRSPGARRPQRSATPPKLIVRNLPWSIKEPEDLGLLFRSFGKVKYVTLPKRGNKLAGFGFVVLRGRKNAEKALAAVNGKEVDGRTLAVDWAVEKEVWENNQKGEEENEEEEKEREENGEESEDEDMEDVEQDDLDNTSSEGSDEDEDEDEDENDDDDLDLDDLDGSKENEEDERNASTIFLRNLPFTCDDATLYEHFKQFGPLRYARVVLDPETERPRGTGFVCFWKPEDAATCVRGAPRINEPPVADKDRNHQALKHSVLQNENADPSGKYTLDGRVLQVARAVNKREATRLEEEGVSRRLVRDKDKRRLYLLSEGTIPSDSPLYKKLSPSEIKLREESYKQRQNFIKKNPALHLSLTRLSVRNLPRHITSKDLKQLARAGVVGFATDVKNGVRQPLSKEERERSSDDMKELEHLRKTKRQGIVRQAKVVFETREGTKVPEKSGGGRSRGYGFIEYFTHRHALMGLRWLNCHAIDIPASAQAEGEKEKKKRLVVEFAIENAQVVKRRNEIQERKRNAPKEAKEKAENAGSEDKGGKGLKRKRSQSRGKDQDGKKGETEEEEEENKVAKRNRIIAQKRMKRKSRKGKA